MLLKASNAQPRPQTASLKQQAALHLAWTAAYVRLISSQGAHIGDQVIHQVFAILKLAPRLASAHVDSASSSLATSVMQPQQQSCGHVAHVCGKVRRASCCSLVGKLVQGQQGLPPIRGREGPAPSCRAHAGWRGIPGLLAPLVLLLLAPPFLAFLSTQGTGDLSAQLATLRPARGNLWNGWDGGEGAVPPEQPVLLEDSAHTVRVLCTASFASKGLPDKIRAHYHLAAFSARGFCVC
jgi:hypothetical protein